MKESSEQLHTEREKSVSVEESQKIAQELLARHDSEITAQVYQDVNGWNSAFAAELYQNAITHYLEQVPVEILEHYTGHGITRGRDLEQLTAALNVLSNGRIRGDTAKLAKSGYIDAYREGPFLVILEKDNAFPGGRPTKELVNKLGIKVNFDTLIVNTKFYPLVDELKKMFPSRNIIKANEIPGYFVSS